MKKVYTEEQLNVLCKAYQKVFYLQDWNIIVKLVHQETIKGTTGRCCYSPGFKCAVIEIPSEDTYIAHSELLIQDMQLSIIHELMHLHFAILDEHCPEGADTQLYEQGINMISRAFVDLLLAPEFDPDTSDLTKMPTEVRSTVGDMTDMRTRPVEHDKVRCPDCENYVDPNNMNDTRRIAICQDCYDKQYGDRQCINCDKLVPMDRIDDKECFDCLLEFTIQHGKIAFGNTFIEAHHRIYLSDLSIKELRLFYQI